MTPCPVASRIFHDWSEALREASSPSHRQDEELLTSYAGAVANTLDRHLAACELCKEPTMTQYTRCSNCQWVHEADSKQGTSFQGVELCQLHAAAPELLEALRLVEQTVLSIPGFVPAGAGTGKVDKILKAARAAIAKATSAPPDPDHA